jgi:hypothetical protein
VVLVVCFTVFNTTGGQRKASLDMLARSRLNTLLMNAVVVALVLCSLVLCEAYVLSVDEDARPFLTDASPRGGVSGSGGGESGCVYWHRGSMLQRLTSTTALRVTYNRVRFITHGFRPRIDKQYTATCLPVQNALCQVDSNNLNAVGIHTGSFVFPTQGPVVVDAGSRHRCSDGSGRDVVTNIPRYDVSACDVIDNVVDVFYTKEGVQIYEMKFNTALYTFVGILVIVLIVLVTQNLAADIFMENSETGSIGNGVCILLGSLLVICSCLLPGIVRVVEYMGDPSQILCVTCNMFFAIVTQIDEHYFYFVLIYVFLQILLSLTFTRTTQLHNVNFMLCSILLTLFSTHGSMETILTMPLVAALLFRMFFKSFTLHFLHCVSTVEAHSVHNGVIEPFFIALDYMLIAATYVTGIEPLCDTILEAYTQFCIVIAITATLAYEASSSRAAK